MSDTLFPFLSRFFTVYLPLLFSLCVHEWAHAWVASLKGDDLARTQGRLSLNPAVHADIVGTVVLPLLSIYTGLPVFGWAKPVPVNPSALSRPKEDMFWIAFAGPLSNFGLALVGALLLTGVQVASGLWPSGDLAFFRLTLEGFIYINLMLGFVNLIPLHPLDGGKVLARFLPVEWNWRLEQWQNYSSMILIFTGLIPRGLPRS